MLRASCIVHLVLNGDPAGEVSSCLVYSWAAEAQPLMAGVWLGSLQLFFHGAPKSGG